MRLITDTTDRMETASAVAYPQGDGTWAIEWDGMEWWETPARYLTREAAREALTECLWG